MINKFIDTLSYDEKIVFFELFCKMVKSDGIVKEEEISCLKAMAQKYGLENKEVVNIIRNASEIDYCREAEKITDRKHALQLIKELCFLSNVDGAMSDAELDIIVDAAEAMNIDEDKVVQINRLVLNNLVLLKAEQIIMEEDDE